MTKEERDNAIKVLKNFDLNNSRVNLLLFSAEEITNAFDTAIKLMEMWEKLKSKVESNIVYYEDGFMCSIAESVEGKKMWNEIKTIMNKLEIEEE